MPSGDEPGRILSAPEERPDFELLRCYDCGLPYRSFPLDVVLPDEQWNAISPTGGHGCVLCAQCIVHRAAKLPGATVVHVTIEYQDGKDGEKRKTSDHIADVGQMMAPEERPDLIALEKLLGRYLDNHCANADAEGMSTLCECRLCLDARRVLSALRAQSTADKEQK